MRGWGVLAVGLLSASAARGVELRPSTSVSGYWDSDAASSGTSGGQGGDVRLDAGISAELLSEPGSRFNWRLGYAPTYERFADLSDLDNWRHRAFGGFDYALTRATTLAAQGNFSRSIRSNLDQFSDPEAPPTAVPELEATDEQIDQGSLSVTLSHRFTHRWSAVSSASYSFVDYDREDRSDFDAATASTSLTYRMSEGQSLGGGVSLSRQTISSLLAEQETRFGSLFGSWTRQINPAWSLDLRAGPTFIDSDVQDPALPRVPTSLASDGRRHPFSASLCPRLPCNGNVLLPDAIPEDFRDPFVPVPDELQTENSSTTVFANIGVSRRGESSDFSLGYSRSASENFGGRTSTIADVLSSSLRWRPTPLWRLELRGSYAVRQQATQQTVPEEIALVPNNGTFPELPADAALIGVGPDGSALILRTSDEGDALDLESWMLGIQATRTLTRRLSGFVSASYVNQRNRGDLESISVFRSLDRFDVGVGLTYIFDPIRL